MRKIIMLVILLFAMNLCFADVYNGTLEKISSTTTNYATLHIQFWDETSASHTGTPTEGILTFISDNGDKVVYYYEQLLNATVNVSSSPNTGTCIVYTTDGVVRKIPYTVGTTLKIYLPHNYLIPITIKNTGNLTIRLHKTGDIVTETECPVKLFLSKGASYDFYLNGHLVLENYIPTSENVLYLLQNYSSNEKIANVDIIRLNNSAILEISTNFNGTLQLYNDSTLIATYNITEGENNFTVSYGLIYKILDENGTIVKSGKITKLFGGKIEEINEIFDNRIRVFLAMVMVVCTLLAGSYISSHIALGLATAEVIVLCAFNVIELHPLIKSLLILLSILSFGYIWIKRGL